MPKNDQKPFNCDFWEVFFKNDVSVATNPHVDTDAPITSLHSHNCLEVSLCSEGYGIVFLGNELRTYSVGDCIVIPAFHPHRSQSAPNTTAKWKTLYIQTESLGKIMPSHGFKLRELPLMHLGAGLSVSVAEHLNAILEELQTHSQLWRSEIAGRLLLLLTYLRRNESEQNCILTTNTLSSEPVAAALNYIADHIGEMLTIPRLAQLCGMSAPHFRRVFKQILRQSPKQYIAQMRIELAKSMLADTRKTVLEIAYDCGFESISAFNRTFKLQTQYAPLQWRRNRNN